TAETAASERRRAVARRVRDAARPGGRQHDDQPVGHEADRPGDRRVRRVGDRRPHRRRSGDGRVVGARRRQDARDYDERNARGERDHRDREAGQRRRRPALGAAHRRCRRRVRSSIPFQEHAMNRLRFAVLALVLLVAAPAFAQTTIAGDWDMTINSPQGANTVKVTFKQDGQKVDGLFKSPAGELAFTGSLVGDELKFTFSIPFQGQPLEIAMTGKVEGAAMTGKANFGGMADGDWTAKRTETATAAAA